jgi:hypothetical protein
MITQAETASLAIWLELAVAYYRQNCKEGFREILREIVNALDQNSVEELYKHDPEGFKVLYSMQQSLSACLDAGDAGPLSYLFATNRYRLHGRILTDAPYAMLLLLSARCSLAGCKSSMHWLQMLSSVLWRARRKRNRCVLVESAYTQCLHVPAYNTHSNANWLAANIRVAL